MQVDINALPPAATPERLPFLQALNYLSDNNGKPNPPAFALSQDAMKKIAYYRAVIQEDMQHELGS